MWMQQETCPSVSYHKTMHLNYIEKDNIISGNVWFDWKGSFESKKTVYFLSEGKTTMKMTF